MVVSMAENVSRLMKLVSKILLGKKKRNLIHKAVRNKTSRDLYINVVSIRAPLTQASVFTYRPQMF